MDNEKHIYTFHKNIHVKPRAKYKITVQTITTFQLVVLKYITVMIRPIMRMQKYKYLPPYRGFDFMLDYVPKLSKSNIRKLI